MAGSSTDYSGAWNNVNFDPGAYSSGVDLGGSSYGSSLSQYQMPSGWDISSDNIGGFSTKDFYGGGFNLDPGSRSSRPWQETWGDTGWGKGLKTLGKGAEFLSSYLGKNSHNLYSGGDPYGRGNSAWGSPANVASSWSQLGSTFKDLGDGNSVETYPTSHQIGYQPGTPGSRGWGSAVVSGLGMALAPFTGGLSAAIAAPISTGMGMANI